MFKYSLTVCVWILLRKIHLQEKEQPQREGMGEDSKVKEVRTEDSKVKEVRTG
ncbi:hypothetical protein PGTUg99_008498 [Puccinia graminis f. sp. tritici]|uniref:Uncharacterized protein n=1 Tax=Puccinia graminis f. sp. tritici TaxID=56615 RepID=A0A5B0MKN4_PUCGR|nr:hypothetical protein PGTUg99_008498 [Puccinia graminis f. sp. tritici]